MIKREIIKRLKEQGEEHLFTETRYAIVLQTLKYGMKKDEWLRNWIPLDPLNKVDWVSDHIIKLSKAGHI